MGDSKNFGTRVTALRNERKLTREELAKMADISPSALKLYEYGDRYPTVTIAERIANALGVTVAALTGEEGEIIERAREMYGSKGVREINDLIEEVSGLFAGGELPEEDKDNMMKAFTEIYFLSKEKNRRFVPKKYRKDEEKD